MRVLLVLFALCGLSVANQLINISKVELLFKKYMLNELSEQDSVTFNDVLELLHRHEYISEISLGTSRQARMSLDCIVCRSAFGALFEGVRNGQTDEEAAAVISALCISLGIQTAAVCTGAVTLNMPIFAHIIRTQPQATPDAFCGLILQRPDNPDVCPFNDERFEWQVELPERSAINAIPQVYNDQPLKVALITDAHIDPLYEAFGVAECDEPVCCRIGQSPSGLFYQSKVDQSILEEGLVNDAGELKLNLSIASKVREAKESSQIKHEGQRNAAPAGYWGDYRNCDTPLWALEDAIDNIHENHNDIDVVYYVGDTIDHGVWETSFELINSMNQYLIDKIRRTFGDHVLVVPALGNHEAQPTNQYAPSSVVGEKLNTTWLYQALVDKWGFYLPDEAKQSLLEQGDFSLLVRPGLRVISLNNNVAYRDNWWLVYDPLDAKRHLDWLVGELHRAELAGEKVHILAHIPPGVHDLTHIWTREYNRIVTRFSATIAAEFNGHTHSDEFKVFYSPEGIPTNVAWGGGSVTTYTYYNLNYKIITFDADTFVPNRILNYAYNLTEANLSPNMRPHWFLLYDMRNSYGLTDLSAQSINNLIYSMVTDNRLLLELYTAFTSKLSDARRSWCDDECKINNLCRTVITVLWERQRCEELRRLFYLH